MRNEGVREATSISESKSTTECARRISSTLIASKAARRTVFPLWLDLHQDFVLAHNLHNLSNIASGFVQQLQLLS